MAGGKNRIKEWHETLTPEERTAHAKKAAAASARAKQKRKTLKEALLVALSDETVQDNIITALIQKASEGSEKAFEVIRDTIGEKPVDKQEITTNEIVVSIEDD